MSIEGKNINLDGQVHLITESKKELWADGKEAIIIRTKSHQGNPSVIVMVDNLE